MHSMCYSGKSEVGVGIYILVINSGKNLNVRLFETG